MLVTLFYNHETNELLNYENALAKEREQTKIDYTFEDFISEEYSVEDLFRYFKKYEDVQDAIADLKRDYEETVNQMAEEELDHCQSGTWTAHEVEI